MAHRTERDELVAEAVQLERQLRLLIDAAEAYVDVGYWIDEASKRQALQDRLATAKAHLS